ncbi:ROK family protein [Paenibacillus psychroresistens]|uniref:ROK family protein n=1 Tax=Paenibacillus psychroresistens TaxID=1778678 RepID=A0A6B8RGZ5_9BACL|nr:ROK family protein [Paenibacillus psychroresistens]QGQ94812.1 ROK family protein [Paenibacillus psychroresistens]
MKYSVGIDIGGTKTAIGIVNEAGLVAAEKVIHTDLAKTPQQMVKEMADVIKHLQVESGVMDEEILGVGIGVPGPLDAAAGKFSCPPNLPSWHDFEVAAEMRKYLEFPLQVQNDATSAALAEKWIGAAQDNANFIYITISTGIGGGLFLDGKLFTGFRGNAGDIGHIVIDPSAGTCICGQKGCIEWVASGTAIARQASTIRGKDTSTKEAFELYGAKDPQMVKLIEQVFEYLGMGIVSLINTFDLEKIVIGGGVSQVGDPLFAAIRAYVRKFALSPVGKETEIVPTKLNQNVGLVGAAALIHLNGFNNLKI